MTNRTSTVFGAGSKAGLHWVCRSDFQTRNHDSVSLFARPCKRQAGTRGIFTWFFDNYLNINSLGHGAVRAISSVFSVTSEGKFSRPFYNRSVSVRLVSGRRNGADGHKGGSEKDGNGEKDSHRGGPGRMGVFLKTSFAEGITFG